MQKQHAFALQLEKEAQKKAPKKSAFAPIKGWMDLTPQEREQMARRTRETPFTQVPQIGSSQWIRFSDGTQVLATFRGTLSNAAYLPLWDDPISGGPFQKKLLSICAGRLHRLCELLPMHCHASVVVLTSPKVSALTAVNVISNAF